MSRLLTAQQHKIGHLVPLKVKSEKRESNHSNRSTSIQNVEIWSEKFRRLWSDPVELSAAECSRFVFNSNSVLRASEDRSVQ